MKMKQIRYSILTLALLVVLSSCTEDKFTPETGNTKVELLPAETFAIEDSYFYLPVHQIESSNTATKVGIELLSSTGTDINGNPYECKDDSTLIFTSKEIYVGPNSGENSDTCSYFEVRLPDYRAIDELSIEVRLVGDNLGDNTTMTYTFKSVEQYRMDGIFQTYGEYDAGDQGMVAIDGQIIISTTEDPLVYGISVAGENPQEFTAERFINRLVINSANAYVASDGYEWNIFQYDGTNIIGATSVELVFLNDNEFIATSGFFAGYVDEEGYYAIASILSPGGQGGRVR